MEIVQPTQQLGVPPQQPATRPVVGRFIGESWDIYRGMTRHIVQFYLKFILQALYFAVPGIAAFLIVRYLRNAGVVDESLEKLLTVVLIGIMVVAVTYIWLWAQVALVFLVRNHSGDRPVDEAMDKAHPLIGKYFWTSFLVGLFTFFWTLLLIIPGIVYSVYYSMAQFVLIDKQTSGLAALRMSKRLVKGLGWQVFKSYLGLIAVLFLGAIAISALGAIFGENTQSVLTVIYEFLAIPYAVIYSNLVYEKVKSLRPEIQ